MKRRETEERNGRGTAVGRMRYIAPGCVLPFCFLLMLLRIAQIGRWEPLLPGEIAAGEDGDRYRARAARTEYSIGTERCLSAITIHTSLTATRGSLPERPMPSQHCLISSSECGIAGDYADAAALEAAINEAAGADSSVTAVEETTEGADSTSEPANGDAGAAESNGSAAESGDSGGTDGDTPKRNAGGRLVLSENAPMSMIAYVISDRPAGLSIEKRSERVYYDDRRRRSCSVTSAGYPTRRFSITAISAIRWMR